MSGRRAVVTGLGAICCLGCDVRAIWERMVAHPDFCYRHPTCRMQTPTYRKKYIDPLPEDPQLPVLVEDADAGFPDLTRYQRKAEVKG